MIETTEHGKSRYVLVMKDDRELVIGTKLGRAKRHFAKDPKARALRRVASVLMLRCIEE